MNTPISQFQLPRRTMALVATVLLLGIVGSAGALYYIGMFSEPTVDSKTAPGYYLAYLDHTGPYDEISPVIERVGNLLEGAGTEVDTPATLFLDDIALVAKDQLRSKVGYLVTASDYVPPSLETEEIAPREVVFALFNGTPAVGSYKSYAAMTEWANNSDRTLQLPALEIYFPNGTVEYQLIIEQ